MSHFYILERQISWRPDLQLPTVVVCGVPPNPQQAQRKFDVNPLAPIDQISPRSYRQQAIASPRLSLKNFFKFISPQQK